MRYWQDAGYVHIYGPADATATPNLIISCLVKIHNSFTFLLLAYLGCPGKEAVKQVFLFPTVSHRHN